MDAQSKSLKATLAHHKKRQEQQKEKLPYSQRDEGRIALDELLPFLAEFIDGPDRPQLPHGLDRVVGQLPAANVALAALSALMNFTATEDGLLAADERKAKPFYRVRYDLADALHRAYWTFLLERDAATPGNARHEFNYDPRRAIAKQGKLLKSDQAGRREALYRSGYRQDSWTNKQRILAGNWLLRCCLVGLRDIFGHRSGVPFIRLWFTDYVTQICADLALKRHPMFLPSDQRPHPWTGWRTGGYWDRHTPISTTFIRGFNSATKAAVEEAFDLGMMAEHVNAVNRLQNVAWSINAKMLPVLRRFAGEDRKKLKAGVRHQLGLRGLNIDGGGVGKAIPALQVLVDIETAENIKRAPFWLPWNCDFRGRLYPIPHFNYGREDHVRSLFLFADGVEMTPEGMDMLAMHVANCGDFDDENGHRISKRSFGERIAWTNNNRALIERIAADPIRTVREWEKADSKFQFVAACMEMAEAWRDPNFKTRMPVAFDATSSGIQHYVLMMKDEVTAPRVNLIDEMSATLADLAAKYPSPSERRKAAQAVDPMRSRVPRDVYLDIRDYVVKAIKAERNNSEPRFTKAKNGKEPKTLKTRGELARFWLDLLKDERNGRKIVKVPAMTYCYGATVGGMADQVRKVWKDWDRDREAIRQEATYLAEHILRASKEILPGPTKAMDYVRQIAGILAKHNLPFTWRPPTGFPWRNEYRLPDKTKIERVDLPFDNVRGKSSRPKISVADGWGEINHKKSMNAAAPNVVHAMDATHLVRTVNAAAVDDITNVATVHDSFAAPAPQAQRFRQIIGTQLMLLYLSGKKTVEWRDGEDVPEDSEGIVKDIVKVVLVETRVLENLLATALAPLRGKLDLLAVQDAEFAFS